MIFRALGIFVAFLAACVPAFGCTAALVSSSRSTTGRPMLWKHRDTGARHNYIARHPAKEGCMEFVALYNSTDEALEEAWVGVNEQGFAILNTASYNIVPDTAAYKDREGTVMSLALGKCHTVDDFATLLDTLARPMGVQANFGVVDASGTMAWFEAHDNGYKRYDYKDTVAVRTNYSHSGTLPRRLGLEREVTATRAVVARPLIAPALFTDTLSRRLWDNVSESDVSRSGLVEVEDKGDFIPRYISTASVVIETAPVRDGIVLHVVLGYPPCSVTRTFTFDAIPDEVRPGENGITPDEINADALKEKIYKDKKTIDLTEFSKL